MLDFRCCFYPAGFQLAQSMRDLLESILPFFQIRLRLIQDRQIPLRIGMLGRSAERAGLAVLETLPFFFEIADAAEKRNLRFQGGNLFFQEGFLIAARFDLFQDTGMTNVQLFPVRFQAIQVRGDPVHPRHCFACLNQKPLAFLEGVHIRAPLADVASPEERRDLIRKALEIVLFFLKFEAGFFMIGLFPGALGKGGFLFPGRLGKLFQGLCVFCLNNPEPRKAPFDGAEMGREQGIGGMPCPVFLERFQGGVNLFQLLLIPLDVASVGLRLLFASPRSPCSSPRAACSVRPDGHRDRGPF